MTLYVIHPDKNVREALARTLETVWDQSVETMEEIPKEPAKDAVYLAPKDTPLPEAHRVTFEGQRLKALITAAQNKHRLLTTPRTIRIGSATLDTVTRDFSEGNKAVSLTEKEAALLIYLAQRGTAATRDDLLREVWQYADGVDTHTIETHIYRLRQKIEADPENPRILLTRKEGYQLGLSATNSTK